MRYISESVQHEKYIGVTKDARGNERESWDPPVALGIYAFNPGTSDEPFTPGHDRVVSSPAIYVPSGVFVGPYDRVTVRGKTYEVNGEPRDFRNPYGAEMNGLQIELKAVTG